MEGVDELVKTVKKRNLISMVGCNMRFHPAIAHLHDTLDGNASFSKNYGKFRIWILSSI